MGDSLQQPDDERTRVGRIGAMLGWNIWRDSEDPYRDIFVAVLVLGLMLLAG